VGERIERAYEAGLAYLAGTETSAGDADAAEAGS
jgi:hypothetical protein